MTNRGQLPGGEVWEPSRARSAALTSSVRRATPPLVGRAWAVALLVLIVSFGLVAVTAGAASAEDELIVESESTFSVNLDQVRIDVDQNFTLRNTKPADVTEDRTAEFFYTSFAFVVLRGAEGVQTIANGELLASERMQIEDLPLVDLITVELPERLAFGETVRLDVRYQVPSGAARSNDPVRVGRSYLAFPVYVCCDPGRTSVRVELPAGFTLEVGGDASELVEVSSDVSGVVLEARAIEDPSTFNAFVFGRNDAELVATQLAVGEATVQIESWTDDPAWATFVAGTTVHLIPELERLVGRPWPIDRELRIVETTTPYLFGYAGWFDHEDAVIEVGENLDARVLAHELSHAWFDNSGFGSHWISEGLAEYFGAEAARSVAGAGGTGDLRSFPDRESFFGQPLNAWERTGNGPSQFQNARESYSYAASGAVIATIADEIGRDGLIEVMRAAEAGEISFAGSGAPETDPDAWLSWQRFMDLTEDRGGYVDVADLFAEWVVTDAEAALLDVRAATHEQFDQLNGRASGWSAPIGVRSALTTWSFDEAVALMIEAEPVLDLREQIAAEATELRLPILPIVQESWEASQTPEDFATTAALAERQLEALASVRQATSQAGAPREWSTEIGLQGDDLDARLARIRVAYEADDLAAIQTEAAAIELLLADAPGNARRSVVLIVVIGVALVMLLGLVVGGRRWRSPHIEPAPAPAPPVTESRSLISNK